MKTTLDLPDELVKKVKLHAIDHGQKLKQAVADLLRKGLDASSNAPDRAVRPEIKVNPRTGLPYIQCPPDAQAWRMTAAQLIDQAEETQTLEDLERLGVSPR